ncbi:MAG TPA: ABC transporter permease subunit [Patescibacteria group bacterium]
MSDHNRSPHIRHYHRHLSISYAMSLRQRLYSFVLVPLMILVVAFLAIFISTGFHYNIVPAIGVSLVVQAIFATFIRLLIAYILALLISIPLALLITRNDTIERLLLPVFDIIQSIPVLAFFPIIILVFIHSNFLSGAAIFILFLSMIWNIVFSLVGGLRTIPGDIKAGAQVFHITGWSYFTKVLIPGVMPYIITGSLLAWAQGWNIVIVAEVLHTYIPGGTSNQDLFGIGSTLVNASAQGDQQLFMLAIICMVIWIGLLNFFVWQKLLTYAEKFKFD